MTRKGRCLDLIGGAHGVLAIAVTLMLSDYAQRPPMLVGGARK
jgi:hypothetical protein